jgi:hypothetical protein
MMQQEFKDAIYLILKYMEYSLEINEFETQKTELVKNQKFQEASVVRDRIAMARMQMPNKEEFISMHKKVGVMLGYSVETVYDLVDVEEESIAYPATIFPEFAVKNKHIHMETRSGKYFNVIYSLANIMDEAETSGVLYCQCGMCIKEYGDDPDELKETAQCVCGKKYEVEFKNDMSVRVTNIL